MVFNNWLYRFLFLLGRHNIAGASGAAIAAGVGALASAGGAVAQGALSAGGAKSAQRAQNQASALGMQQTDKAMAQAQANLAPYMQAGYGGLYTLLSAMGLAQKPTAPNQGDFYYETTDTIHNGKQVVKIQKFDQQGYNNAVKQYQSQLGIYNQLQKSPVVGSLLKNFGAGQYQQEPGYTPMVGTMAQWKQNPMYTPLPTTLAQLQQTPGYQFRLQQGLQGAQNSAAARGSLMSGGTLKALQQYGQGLASQEYQSAWDRAQTAYQNAWQRGQGAYQSAFNRNLQNKSNLYSMLSGLSTAGQNAAQTLSGQGISTAGTQANLANVMGQNAAQSQYAQSNAYANTAANLGNTITSGLENYALLNNLNNNQASGYSNPVSRY